jgi:hypothetical protein
MVACGFSTSPDGILVNIADLSSPKFMPTIESVSLKIDDKGISNATDDALNGISIIGATGYKPYLLCGNL